MECDFSGEMAHDDAVRGIAVLAAEAVAAQGDPAT